LKNPATYYKRWNAFSGYEKVALLRATMTLLMIKTGLTVLPFSTFRKIFHWFSKTNRVDEISQRKIKQMVWAIESAATHLPFELLCLPRALAAKYLLRKVPSLTLEIGVEINSSKVFEAHAWVEKNGTIIIGDWPESVSYQRLWVWA